MNSFAWILFVPAIALAVAAPAATFESRLERGRTLYERNCELCHTPSIHTRPNKLPLTRDELAAIVDHFRRTENLEWTPEEVNDVVEYLNRTRYRFAPR